MPATQKSRISAEEQGADNQENSAWMDVPSAVIQSKGPGRAHFLLKHAHQRSLEKPTSVNAGYINNNGPSEEALCPRNIEIEERLREYCTGGQRRRFKFCVLWRPLSFLTATKPTRFIAHSQSIPPQSGHFHSPFRNLLHASVR